jgi:hypothetical protein
MIVFLGKGKSVFGQTQPFRGVKKKPELFTEKKVMRVGFSQHPLHTHPTLEALPHAHAKERICG